ncbi:conserved protein of unknown function [Petrocella atlantisensis]|uniref:YgiT-type zinc finger protein n=1 Tax=Petrocella atlantisensis TaxID=2173034 RepID=A0A3P7PNX8_9FIRM|nr:hypothetical protein [Petrocella atlantisensis]VDN46197.1 conserved protein of unknown function [Petrocella atlantisensis]
MNGFCEKCRDTVDYNVKMIDKKKEIKGKMILYVGKEAYCAECKEEIFVPEVRDYNLRELDTAYRKVEN